MREINFRGKCIKTGNWVYGDLCQDPKINFVGILRKADKPYELLIAGGADFYFKVKQVDSETVGEYTGVKGKKENKIYEGDIFAYHFDSKKVGIVKFGQYRNPCDDIHTSHVGFYVEWQDKFFRKMTRCDLAYWAIVSDVVGNVSDNPELIEGSGEICLP